MELHWLSAVDQIDFNQSIKQSTHLFEYNSDSGWLKKTNTLKFDIKLIKTIKIIMTNA